MSEPTGMSIEIGGAIRESDLEELLGLVTDGEIYDMYSDSPTTVSDLKRAIKAGERIEWGGTSNYGSCDDLSAWLRVHLISYIHTSGSTGQYNAAVYFWTPGMRSEEVYDTSVDDEEPIIGVEEIRPVCNLMLDLLKNKNAGLALHINDESEDVKKIVEKSMKKPEKLIPLLAKKLNELLPAVPKLPPVTLLHN